MAIVLCLLRTCIVLVPTRRTCIRNNNSNETKMTSKYNHYVTLPSHKLSYVTNISFVEYARPCTLSATRRYTSCVSMNFQLGFDTLFN